MTGSSAKVLDPIEIGDNSQIRANFVVLKNIPAKIAQIINDENTKIKSV